VLDDDVDAAARYLARVAGERLGRVISKLGAGAKRCSAVSMGQGSATRTATLSASHASNAASRPPSLGSGPSWFATPSLNDYFARHSMPVYPSASQSFALGQPRGQKSNGHPVTCNVV